MLALMVDDTTSLLQMKLLQLYLVMAHRSIMKIERLRFTYGVVVYNKSAISISIIHIQLYTMCCSFHKERKDGISIFPFKIFLDVIVDPNMSLRFYIMHIDFMSVHLPSPIIFFVLEDYSNNISVAHGPLLDRVILLESFTTKKRSEQNSMVDYRIALLKNLISTCTILAVVLFFHHHTLEDHNTCNNCCKTL